MKLMRVGGGDERFAETFGDFDRAPVRIEEAPPEMAELDRVKQINSFQQFFPNGTAEDIERMGRDREQRRTAPGSQLFEIIQGAERDDFFGGHSTKLRRRLRAAFPRPGS